jgi:hypothetical protein
VTVESAERTVVVCWLSIVADGTEIVWIWIVGWVSTATAVLTDVTTDGTS